MNESLHIERGGTAVVAISRRNRTDYVLAHVSGPCAVHHSDWAGWWRVTHLATGYCYAEFGDRNVALRYARMVREAAEKAGVDLAVTDGHLARERLLDIGAKEMCDELGGRTSLGTVAFDRGDDR